MRRIRYLLDPMGMTGDQRPNPKRTLCAVRCVLHAACLRSAGLRVRELHVNT